MKLVSEQQIASLMNAVPSEYTPEEVKAYEAGKKLGHVVGTSQGFNLGIKIAVVVVVVMAMIIVLTN
jgi:tetrahydromethanopterin S-methyltransferase subunit G